MATQRKRLFVSPSGSSWKVHWEGEDAGSTYSTKEEATRRARALIASLPEGTCSQILIQRADGQFQTEWTYGKDPFPPRG